MIAVGMPGAQRVLARQVGRQRRLSRVGGLVGYLPPPPGDNALIVDVAAAMSAVSWRLASDQTQSNETGTAKRVGRLINVSNTSSSSGQGKNSSSSMGAGLGALLTAGGLLLASQAMRDCAAAEAKSSQDGLHDGDDHPSNSQAGTDSRDETSIPSCEDNRKSVQEVQQESCADVREEEPTTTDEGATAIPEFDGRYKFYILSEKQAAAEMAAASSERTKRGRGGALAGRALLERYAFVIIGEGSTADAAVESILRMQPEAHILFLSDRKPACPDESSTHTGSYESDFRLLRSDLLESFNQWRRHLTFRVEGFQEPGGEANYGGDGKGSQRSSQERREEESGWRSAYGLARGKAIQYHTYQPHALVIEPERRCVRLLLEGVDIYYDKCLIANSGSPRHDHGDLAAIKGLSDGARHSDKESAAGNPQREKGEKPSGATLPTGPVNRLMSLQDFVSLELLTKDTSVRHVTVLGGSFLGCEVALALAERGRSSSRDMAVSHVYPESTPLQHMLPDYLAQHVQSRLSNAGVTPIGGASLAKVRYSEEDKRVEGVFKRGEADQAVQTDYVVVASTHIDPKVDAASDSALEIDQGNGGIVVNGLFEAVNGVYAAGSAASFFDPVIGRRRVATHDHCINSGLYAGYNMAASLKAAQNDHAGTEEAGSALGKGRVGRLDKHFFTRDADVKGLQTGLRSLFWNLLSWPPSAPHPRLYDHLPFWRSNLAGCGIVMEGLGEIDPRLRTVGVWTSSAGDWACRESRYKCGIVYYMRGDKVAGILLLNLSDQLEKAREVLRQRPKISSISQLKKLIKLGATELIRLIETPGAVPASSPSK